MNKIDRQIEEEFEKLVAYSRSSDISWEDVQHRAATINELYKERLRRSFVLFTFLPIVFMLFVIIGFWLGKSVWL